MDKKNILLTYAPGHAGNHIANLICLNTDFVSRQEQIYEDDWKTHSWESERDLRLFDDKRQIILGHVDEMYVLDWNFEATDTQLLNIEHDGDEFFQMRTEKMFLGLEPDNNDKLFMHLSHHRFNFFYNSDVIQRLLNAPSVLTLTTSQISNFNSLYEFIVNTLDISIDRALAESMHSKWKDNNQKWLFDL